MTDQSYWTRLSQQRLSRRGALRGAAVGAAGLAGAALIGCGDDDDDDDDDDDGGGGGGGGATATATGTTASTPADQPVSGGTVTMPGSDGSIFDPAAVIRGGTVASVFSIYEGLNYFDTNFTLTSGMAELPEQVDELTVIYKIKPDVFWQDKAPLDGRQFTADDAAFGLQRFGQDNSTFVFGPRFSMVDQYEVVDDLTLRLNLSEPFGALLANVAEASSLMVSRDAVEAFGDEGIAANLDNAIGTGPFMPVSREESVETVFEKNPNYYRTGQPYFDEYRVIWFADLAARLAAFVSGQTDWVNSHWIGSLQDLETVQDQVGKDEVTGVPNPTTGGPATHFNTKVPPYDDPRVRTALHLALDRTQLLAIGRGGTVLGGPIPSVLSPYGFTEQELRATPGFREGAERDKDVANAKAMLEASGVDHSSAKMQVRSSATASDFGQVMQQNWAEIGFNVEIQELTTSDILAARKGRENFSLVVLGRQGSSDPDLLYNDLHPDGGQNYGNFSDERITALLEKGRRSYDPTERNIHYKEAQDLLLAELNPQLWAVNSNSTVSFRSNLRGFRPTPSVAAGNIVLAGMWRAPA